MAATPTIAQAVRASVEHAEKAAALLAEAERPQAYTTSTPTGTPVTEHYHRVEGPGATVEATGILTAAMAYATLAEAYARLAGAMVVNAAAISDVAASHPPTSERH